MYPGIFLGYVNVGFVSIVIQLMTKAVESLFIFLNFNYWVHFWKRKYVERIECALFSLQLFHKTLNRISLKKCRYLISGSRNISESSSAAARIFEI